MIHGVKFFILCYAAYLLQHSTLIIIFFVFHDLGFLNMLNSFVSVGTNEVQMCFCCLLFSFNLFSSFHRTIVLCTGGSLWLSITLLVQRKDGACHYMITLGIMHLVFSLRQLWSVFLSWWSFLSIFHNIKRKKQIA